MKVSVIIPIYNAEAYLEKCIQSILQQTYQDYELIMVNDGSTDHSKEVIENILSQNDKIKIINQSNQGVSGARNTGIIHATGKYIVFIDSDDFVATNYLEKLMEATNNGKIDLVLSGTSYIKEKKEIRVVSMDEDIWGQNELDTKFSYIDYTTSIHGKLYKKEIIDRYKLQFNTTMSFAEDRDFNIEFIKYMTVAHNIPFIGYTYNTDIPNSLSKKKYHYKFKNDCIYWNKALLLNDKQNYKVFVANRFYNAVVDNISEMIKWLGLKQSISILSNEYLDKHQDFISSNKTYIKAPKWQKSIICKRPIIYCIIFWLIYKFHE